MESTNEVVVIEIDGRTLRVWGGSLDAERPFKWAHKVECTHLADMWEKLTPILAGMPAGAQVLVMHDGRDRGFHGEEITGGVLLPGFQAPLVFDEFEAWFRAAGMSSVRFERTIVMERIGLHEFQAGYLKPADADISAPVAELPDKFCYLALGGSGTRVITVFPGNPEAYKTAEHRGLSHLDFADSAYPQSGGGQAGSPKTLVAGMRTEDIVFKSHINQGVLAECRSFESRIELALFTAIRQSGATLIVLSGVGPRLLEHMLVNWKYLAGWRGEHVRDDEPADSLRWLYKAIVDGSVGVMVAEESAPLLGALTSMRQALGEAGDAAR